MGDAEYRGLAHIAGQLEFFKTLKGPHLERVLSDVELHGYDRTRALALTREIYSRLRKVFAVAHDLGIPTSVAADRIVEQRLAQGRRERTSNGASAADVSGNPATSIAEVVAQPH